MADDQRESPPGKRGINPRTRIAHVLAGRLHREEMLYSPAAQVSGIQEKENTMRKWTVAVTVAVLALSFAYHASAQLRRRAYTQQGSQQYQQNYPQTGQPLTAGRYDASQRATGPMQGVSLTDQQLANWLLVDNRGEIQLARIAQERAACDEVKDFAKRLIDDHADMVEKLQQFAGTGRTTQQGTRESNQSGGLNFVRLKQQLGQQCVSSAQQELE